VIKNIENGQNCSLKGSSVSQSASQNSNFYGSANGNFRNERAPLNSDQKSIKILSQGSKLKN
jgi:hypothetical protein